MRTTLLILMCVLAGCATMPTPSTVTITSLLSSGAAVGLSAAVDEKVVTSSHLHPEGYVIVAATGAVVGGVLAYFLSEGSHERAREEKARLERERLDAERAAEISARAREARLRAEKERHEAAAVQRQTLLTQRKERISQCEQAVVIVRSPTFNSYGTAFHVGEGVFFTARHVLEGCGPKLKDIGCGKIASYVLVGEHLGVPQEFLRDSHWKPLDVGMFLIKGYKGPSCDLKQPASDSFPGKIIGFPGWGLEKELWEGYVGIEDKSLIYKMHFSPGASGSPILNEDGYVVGIVSGGMSDGSDLGIGVPVGQGHFSKE